MSQSSTEPNTPGNPLPAGGATPPPPAPATPPAPAPAGPPPAAPPARPEGIADEEWNSLGDPGKRAIIRERERATRAEHDLAAARARPTPPPGAPAAPPAAPAAPPAAPAPGTPQDIATIVSQAVAAAIAPIQQSFVDRDAATTAERIREAVNTAAADRFHDPTDAFVGIDVTQLTNDAGQPDPAKITSALDELLTRKPHLGKPFDPTRQAVPGGPIGNQLGGATPPMQDRVNATLARMQASAGIKPS